MDGFLDRGAVQVLPHHGSNCQPLHICVQCQTQMRAYKLLLWHMPLCWCSSSGEARGIADACCLLHAQAAAAAAEAYLERSGRAAGMGGGRLDSKWLDKQVSMRRRPEVHNLHRPGFGVNLIWPQSVVGTHPKGLHDPWVGRACCNRRVGACLSRTDRCWGRAAIEDCMLDRALYAGGVCHAAQQPLAAWPMHACM